MGRKPFAVVLDIDECISSFTGQVCRIHNKLYGTSITAHDIDSWSFEGISVEDVRGTKVTGEELFKTYKDYEDDGLYASMPLIPNAKEALVVMRSLGYKIILLTAREEKFEKQTNLFVHNNDLPFDEIIFDANKAKRIRQLAKTLNIQVFADDKFSTVEDVSENTNVNMVFLIETAVNREVEVEENIIKVKDLFEITRYLKEVKK